MRSHGITSLSEVTNLLTKSCLCVDFNDPPKDYFTDQPEKYDDNVYVLDGLEEVFSDHILMDKRLRKTLYAADDLPNHPPIALTGLAFELFSKAVPNYGLDILDMDYVSAVSENARISPCAMIIAMIYLERLHLRDSEYLETVSPPGLFVVTMLVASKFLFENEDNIVTNQMWAEALNLDVKDLNNQERDFLSAIDWKILVDSHEFFSFLCNIEKVVAIKQSSLRNWLSYSDVCVIVQDPSFQCFWKDFLKNFFETTLLWTFGYIATAVALYCTGISLQKMQLEEQCPQDLVENGTILLQNNLGRPFADTGLTLNVQSAVEFPSSSLNFETSRDEPENYKLQNTDLLDNCYSLPYRRKITYYLLKRTKPDPLHKLTNIFYGYLSRISQLSYSISQLNSSYTIKLNCLKERNDSISALVR